MKLVKGSIAKSSPQVSLLSLEIEILGPPKSKWSLLVGERLYSIIILLAAFPGNNFPKSISSIEKHTFEPMVDT